MTPELTREGGDVGGKHGASADADRACALRAEPAAQSQAEPLVPSAGEYATLVFYHESEDARRSFCREMFDRFPFGGDTPTRLTAIAIGDATGVSEAMRMALECEDIRQYEQRDLALELAECTSWEDCLAKFTEWELEPKDGQLVDLRPAGGDAQ